MGENEKNIFSGRGDDLYKEERDHISFLMEATDGEDLMKCNQIIKDLQCLS